MTRATGIASRLGYYFRSIPTLFGEIENWPFLFHLLSGKQAVIWLRNGCRFQVRSLMDVWIIKETCLDRQYELYGTRIEDGWTVIDIGAGLGDFAILIARENPRSLSMPMSPSRNRTGCSRRISP